MLIKTLLKGLSTSILLSAAFFANADEFTIDFDDAGSHGRVLDNEYVASNGGKISIPGVDVTFWAQSSWSGNGTTNTVSNTNSDLYLALFDSDMTGTLDDDLEVDEGNLAIIHERNSDCERNNGNLRTYCKDGNNDKAPDDRYNSNSSVVDERNKTVYGGFMFVAFSQPVSVHSISLADIEGTQDQLGQIGFLNDSGVFLANYTDMPITGHGGYATQNTATEISQGDTVSYIVFKMIGSGGIGDIEISRTATSVPEPASVAMLGLGLLMMRRFRKS